MSAPRALLVATTLSLSALSLSSCGPKEIALEIDFTPDALAAQAAALELHVVDRCADVTPGEVPSTSLASVAFRRSDAPRAVPGALPERFGVAVIARDPSCHVVGAGCVDGTRGLTSLRVEVTAVDGAACAEGTCSEGLCEGLPMGDASIDASSLDASSEDAGPVDAAPDAFVPEAACDCLDDDVDGRIDEGCATQVLWQTPVDAAGTQGLRGATWGGDARIYLNGWMDTLGADVSLCGASGLRGTGTSGSSYLVGLDAVSGACTSILERTETSPLSRSPFAMPHRGLRGTWLFAGPRVAELSGTSELRALALNTNALFDVGDVLPRPGSTEDLLVHWWRATDAQPTLLGTAVGTGSSDPLVLVGGTPAAVTASTPLPHDALAGWLDASRIFVVASSAGGEGFPCSNAAEHPSTGPLRIELRDASDLTRCSAAFGAPIDPSGMREQLAVSSGARLWVAILVVDRYEILALDTASGALDTLSVTSPPRPDEGDTLVHLAPAAGGDAVVGLTLADGPTGARTYEGRLLRLGMEEAVIVERARRSLANGVSGLSTDALGTTAYASAVVRSSAPLCAGGTFAADGGGLLVHAIELEP